MPRNGYPDLLSGTVTYANATTRTVTLTPAGNLTTLTNSLSGEAPQFRHYYNRTGQVTNRRVSVLAYEYSPPGTGSAGYTSNKMSQSGLDEQEDSE